MTHIKIDVSQIPEIERRLLASSLIDGLIEHFNNPENQRRFKEWQKVREQSSDVSQSK